MIRYYCDVCNREIPNGILHKFSIDQGQVKCEIEVFNPMHLCKYCLSDHIKKALDDRPTMLK